MVKGNVKKRNPNRRIEDYPIGLSGVTRNTVIQCVCGVIMFVNNVKYHYENKCKHYNTDEFLLANNEASKKTRKLNEKRPMVKYSIQFRQKIRYYDRLNKRPDGVDVGNEMYDDWLRKRDEFVDRTREKLLNQLQVCDVNDLRSYTSHADNFKNGGGINGGIDGLMNLSDIEETYSRVGTVIDTEVEGISNTIGVDDKDSNVSVKNTNIIPPQKEQGRTLKSRGVKKRGATDSVKSTNTRSQNKSKEQPLRRSTRNNKHSDDHFESEFSTQVL